MQALLLQGWDAGGHALGSAWAVWFGRSALAVLVGGTVALLVRATLRRHWYRAADVLRETDVAAVHAALLAAERRTVGEILPVVLERSDRHPGACWLAALVSVLLGTAGLMPWLPWSEPALVLASQLVLGAAGYALARFLPDFQRFFLSEARASEVAEEQAFQEFHRYELSRTEGRTGVLLFVSLLERRAIVLADEGIDRRVELDTWKRTNEALLAGVRRGSLVDGIVAGIERAGEVLEQHFPVASGDRNEVPDRLIIRRE